MKHPSDMTPAIDLTAERGTGPMPVAPSGLARPAAALQQRLPGRRERAGLARRWRRPGTIAQAWETILRDNPLPAVHGRVCYHPCESACNRGETGRGGQHPRGRTLPRRPGAGAGLDAAASTRRRQRQARADRRRRTERAVGRLSPRPPRPRGRDPRGRAAAGRHAAFRHPGLSPAARRTDARRSRASKRMGVKIVLNHKVDDLRGRAGRPAGSTPCSSRSARTSRKHVDIPARDAARVLDAVALLRDVATGEAPRLGRRVVVYGGGNTAMDAARTARRLGAEEALIVYRRDRAHMPAHAFEADEAIAEGVKIRWLTTIKDIAGASLTVETHGRSTRTAARVPTGEFETLAGRCGRAGARPGHRQRLPAPRAGHRVQARRHGGGRPRHDDRRTRHLRRRRHGAERAHRHRRGRARQARRAAHRRLAARRAAMRSAGHAARRHLRDAEPAGLQRRRPGARSANCRWRRAPTGSPRSWPA